MRIQSRSDTIDAVARVVARHGPAGIRWSTIEREAGISHASRAWSWFQDMPALVDECYSRTAQGLEESLLRAETAPGNALEKLAAFLVGAFETRRERGQFLAFQPVEELSPPRRKRLRERELMVLARLKRLLSKGQRDGSLALRHADSTCAMILACLQVPVTADTAAEQQMWDAEIVELLLAALAEPHPTETLVRRDVPIAQGACACGAVRYELRGPLAILSHCQCSLCRKHREATLARCISAPLAAFRWLEGEASVTTYRGASSAQRSFCKVCGSVTATVDEDSGTVLCPSANLQGVPSQ